MKHSILRKLSASHEAGFLCLREPLVNFDHLGEFYCEIFRVGSSRVGIRIKDFLKINNENMILHLFVMMNHRFVSSLVFNYSGLDFSLIELFPCSSSFKTFFVDCHQNFLSEIVESRNRGTRRPNRVECSSSTQSCFGREKKTWFRERPMGVMRQL